MNFAYIATLLVLCFLFAVGVYLMKYMRNRKFFNLMFLALVYIPYICMSIFIYKTDTDPARWNFLNTLPVANISPFMFSIVPILLILPRKLREHLYLLIAMMTVGMFFSTCFGCIGNAMRDYKFHFHFVLDYVSHFALAAFGIFLIRTKQVKFNGKNCLISSSFIFSVVTVMLILNVIFDKAFFGLSLNGKHNIYNMVLVENSYLSALIYYCGLAAVLYLGYVLCKILQRDRFTLASDIV